VDLKARISGELNFALSALNGVGTVIETFSSHFDFGTLDMGVFNKCGSDSTGAIAIFLWGSSHDTPTFGSNSLPLLIFAAFGGKLYSDGTVKYATDPAAIDIAFTGQIPEPRTYVMLAMGLLSLSRMGLVARRRVSVRPRLA